MIKKLLYILLLALMVVPFANTLISCGGGDDGGDEGPQLSVSPSSVSLAGTEEVKINVSANVTWNVSVDASWLHVINTGGSRNGSFTIYADDNTTGNVRSTRVHVKAERANLETTVAVTQAAGGPANQLTVSPSSMSFDYSGGSNTFTISSNVTWTVSSSSSWCTVSSASGSNDKKVTVIVSENTTNDDRNATITVSGGGMAKTIAVSQGHKNPEPYLNVDKSSISFSSSSGNDSFSISSNVSWTVSSSESWCTVSPTSGSNDKAVTITVSENTTSDSRTATITVSGSGLTKTINVTQEKYSVLFLEPCLVWGTSVSSVKSFMTGYSVGNNGNLIENDGEYILWYYGKYMEIETDYYFTSSTGGLNSVLVFFDPQKAGYDEIVQEFTKLEYVYVDKNSQGVYVYKTKDGKTDIQLGQNQQNYWVIVYSNASSQGGVPGENDNPLPQHIRRR